MLGPCNYGMGDVDGGIGEKGDQDGDRQPLENGLGILGVGVDGLDDGHGTPRALGERSPTGASSDLIAILTDVLRGEDGAGDEGGNEDDQEKDGVPNVKVLEQ